MHQSNKQLYEPPATNVHATFVLAKKPKQLWTLAFATFAAFSTSFQKKKKRSEISLRRGRDYTSWKATRQREPKSFVQTKICDAAFQQQSATKS